jgi:hypothetical protein
MTVLKLVLGAIGAFIGPAAASIQGHLNVVELIRVLAAAFFAGGGTLGVLATILPSIGLIFPSPNDAALATAVLTGVSEVIRRLSHGTPNPASFI